MYEIIRTVQLSKCFGKTLALDRVNLTLTNESVYALLGANGAGKSTTLQILLNLLQPTSGYAEVLGNESRQLSAEDFTRIGYVAEGQDLPDWMTVGRLMQYLKPFYPQWNDVLAGNLLRDFSLPLDRKLGHLSRGMRMKVALTAALAYRPRLLVMDEPLSALDSLTRDELIEVLLANMQGTSILICSHDLAEVETFASHIGYLENGRLQFSESASCLTERFREVEVTLGAKAPTNKSEWPPYWLNADRCGSVVRFIDMQFQRERTMNEIKRMFHDVIQVEASPMPLRSIFVTLAKASRRAA